MCLAVPARILSIEGDRARVEVGGLVRDAGLHLLEGAEVGKYVLLHAGFAIQVLDEEDALETLRLLEEMDEVP